MVRFLHTMLAWVRPSVRWGTALALTLMVFSGCEPPPPPAAPTPTPPPQVVVEPEPVEKEPIVVEEIPKPEPEPKPDLKPESPPEVVVPEPEVKRERIKGDFRVWTSYTGVQIEAELVEVVGDLVLLRTPYDEKKQIPLNQLQSADQIFARQATLPSAALTRGGQVVVRVNSRPQQQMIYGMDFERLWHLGALQDLDRLAQLAVSECKVEYVRIAINGAAEINEGKIDWSVYEKDIFKVMRALKKANPRIKFFASPRPFHEAVPGSPFTPFPLWITVFKDGANRRAGVTFYPDKAAKYMVRQIRYLRSQGFNIVYMDAKNECCLFLRPGEIGKMIDLMRKEMGSDMPLVIAPSSHNRAVGQKWLEEAIQIGRTDFFDIIASHNTNLELGSFEDFMNVAKRLRKPVWNTEMHGFHGPDELAVENSIHLWDHIRAGFSGINDWLSLGSDGKEHKMFRNVGRQIEAMRTYYIFKQLVNTSGGGNYLATSIPNGLKATAAFLKDKTLTVWVLNSSKEPVSNVALDLGGMIIANPSVNILWWGPDNAREGSKSNERIIGPGPFTYDMAANSLYCFTFTTR